MVAPGGEAVFGGLAAALHGVGAGSRGRSRAGRTPPGVGGRPGAWVVHLQR